MINKIVNSLIFIVILYATPSFSAGIGLAVTRVIYPAGSHGVTVELNNSGKGVYLVQPFISSHYAERKDAPFTVTPAVFRLEGGAENILRINSLPDIEKKPQNQESLFWLVVKAVPSSTEQKWSPNTGGVTGGVKLGLGTAIKLIYRPEVLSTPGRKDFGLLRFTRVRNGVDIYNPGPYYINLSYLSFDGTRVVDKRPEQYIIQPFSSTHYDVNTAKFIAKVAWGVINDIGGIYEYTGEIK